MQTFTHDSHAMQLKQPQGKQGLQKLPVSSDQMHGDSRYARGSRISRGVQAGHALQLRVTCRPERVARVQEGESSASILALQLASCDSVPSRLFMTADATALAHLSWLASMLNGHPCIKASSPCMAWFWVKAVLDVIDGSACRHASISNQGPHSRDTCKPAMATQIAEPAAPALLGVGSGWAWMWRTGHPACRHKSQIHSIHGNSQIQHNASTA